MLIVRKAFPLTDARINEIKAGSPILPHEQLAVTEWYEERHRRMSIAGHKGGAVMAARWKAKKEKK